MKWQSKCLTTYLYANTPQLHTLESTLILTYCMYTNNSIHMILSMNLSFSFNCVSQAMEIKSLHYLYSLSRWEVFPGMVNKLSRVGQIWFVYLRCISFWSDICPSCHAWIVWLGIETVIVEFCYTRYVISLITIELWIMVSSWKFLH